MRAAAPAPVAVTSGTTPRMKANEVIRIGRKPRARRLDGGLDDRLAVDACARSRATSTIRMAFLAPSAISSIRPIWV